MAHIGNAPFGKTVRTVTSETLTSVKTAYYPTGGYIVGYVDVYVNGVRLTETADFTATDGTTVTLQYNPSIGDTVDVVTYGSIELANAVRRDGDTLVGTLYTRALVPTANVTYDIGTSTMRYKDLYLSGNTINLGDVQLTTNGTAFSVSNTTGGVFPSALANTTITGTLFTNGAVTFANSTSNTLNFFANGKVSIGASAAWNDLNIFGANNRFVSITSPSGSNTRVGIDLNPSMSVNEAANNQPQARIYSVDNNYGASIVFANKTQGALGNSLTDKMQVAATGDVFINTANNTTGGFFNKLIVKQSSSSWAGGIGVEASSNDHVLTMGCDATTTSLTSSYRTSSGYKPLILRAGGYDAVNIDTSGRVQMPYQICLQAGAQNIVYNNSTTNQHWGTTGYVYQNQGSAWNASTGIFTSPISATYMVIAKVRFSVENNNGGGSYNYIQFNNTNSSVNGTPILLWSPASFTGGTYRPYMLTAIMKLNTNDTISPRLYIYGGGTVTCDGGTTGQTDDQLSIIQIG